MYAVILFTLNVMLILMSIVSTYRKHVLIRDEFASEERLAWTAIIAEPFVAIKNVVWESLASKDDLMSRLMANAFNNTNFVVIDEEGNLVNQDEDNKQPPSLH